ETPQLSFSTPLLPEEYMDPDPSTPAGIILVLLIGDPGQPQVSVSDFTELMYTDQNGQPIYFSDVEQAIQVADLLNIGNEFNQFVLMPVLATNRSGSGPVTWFENDCVQLYTQKSLTLIENPVE